MEPVDIIVSALATGAKAAVTDTAKQALKDAYNVLKAAIKRKFDSVDVTPVENKPESEDRRKLVSGELVAAGADRDGEVLEAATRLLDLIEQHAPEAGRAVGVELDKVRARRIDLSGISAMGPSATGASIKDAEAEYIRIHGVDVEAARDHQQNP